MTRRMDYVDSACRDARLLHGIAKDTAERLLRTVVPQQDDGASTQREVLAYMIARLAAHDGIRPACHDEVGQAVERSAQYRDALEGIGGVAPYTRLGIKGMRTSLRQLVHVKAARLAQGAEPGCARIRRMFQRSDGCQSYQMGQPFTGRT